jgi:hypothetical protein
MKVQCSKTGVCYLGCAAGVGVCDQSTVTCGDNACTTGCTAGGSKPDLQCGQACGCNGC